MFLMRFDMRAPAFSSASASELYAAALDMAAWGEKNGCLAAVLSEHHGSEDGFLPAPLVLASAMAGRTSTLPIQIAAVVLPLHDPIAMAEQMAVLDITSGGRVSYVVAVGYREEEFAMFDRPFRARGRRMDACLEALQNAWTGESFEFEGRTLRVTPKPLTPGGPMLMMGGNSAVIARRAARFGIGIMAQGGNPEVEQAYNEECMKLGVEPGVVISPPVGTVTAGFVAEDPDRAWAQMGPHLLHDARAYARWMDKPNAATSGKMLETVDELRAERGSYRIFTPEEAVAHIQSEGIFVAQPLCGGLPPDLAWPSLELLVERVLPNLSASPTIG